MSKTNNYRPATIALHHGYNPSETDHKSIAVPLHVNTAFAFDDSQTAKDVFELRRGGFLYTRLNNPTTAVLESRLAAFEGGVGAVATSCGQSAHALLFLTLLKSGDHIVASSSIYGGTFNLLSVTLPKFGITTTFVPTEDLDSFEQAIQPNTKFIFTEILGNPKLDFVDVRAIADIAHRNGLPYVVDNTLTTGLYRPFDDGADIVTYALTKYVCGNGTTMGGAVIDSGHYDWGNGLFPEFVEPNSSYHGVVFAEAFGAGAMITRLVVEGLRDLGLNISPHNSFALLQGLETTKLRIRAISHTTLELGKWLEQHPLVAWVKYPLLESHPTYALCREKLPEGAGGIITFGAKGGFEASKRVGELTEIFKIVANLGDSKSLLIHPASTTHNQLSPKDQAAAGVTPDLIRLSIGLEDIEDLKYDLDQALTRAHE